MEWYYMEGEKRIGPVAQDALIALIRSGTVNRSTPVWRDGIADWLELGQSELASFIATPPPEPRKSVPPSYTPPPVTAQPTSTSFARDPKKVYPSNPPKSPNLCWWNVIWPGIAQLALGQVGKGILLLLVSPLSLLILPLAFAVVVASVVDGYQVGKVLKSGRPVGNWQFFPS
jgi:hypothetical protein